MSSWKKLSKIYKPSKSYLPVHKPSQPIVRGFDEAVLRLADNMIVNDLQPEYYYSLNAVVNEAIDAHREVIDSDEDVYLHVIETMMPIALECQKALAALYIFDRLAPHKGKDFVNELLQMINPRWRLLVLEILKKPADELKLKHKGWGRRARALAKNLILKLEPFQVMKYAKHVKNLARWAHLSPELPQVNFVFENWKKDEEAKKKLMQTHSIYRDYISMWELSKAGKIPLSAVRSSSLPYTILKGFLGQLINKPEYFKALLPKMTVWEVILSLRQIENRGLMDDVEVRTFIKNKLKTEHLKNLRIDLRELFQAYKAVRNEFTREILYDVICNQLEELKNSLKPLLKELKIGIAIDQSGSMLNVIENSLALGFALATGGAKKVKVVTFSEIAYDIPMPKNPKDLIKLIDQLRPLGSTSIGAGMKKALEIDPDILIVISDMEQNTEPWSEEVWKEYMKRRGKKPIVIALKFTTSPKESVGEIQAMIRGRWLNIGEDENDFVVRNTWDIVRIIEYVLKLKVKILEISKKRRKKKAKKKT